MAALIWSSTMLLNVLQRGYILCTLSFESGAYYRIQTFQMLNMYYILQAKNCRLLTVLDCWNCKWLLRPSLSCPYGFQCWAPFLCDAKYCHGSTWLESSNAITFLVFWTGALFILTVVQYPCRKKNKYIVLNVVMAYFISYLL